jgi:Lipocalin-like domain
MNSQDIIRRATIGRTTALLGVALLIALGLAALAIASSTGSLSQKPETRAEVERALIGTWRLTSFPVTDQNGDVVGGLYGDDPVAKLTYTPQGDVWAFVGSRVRTDPANPAQQLWYTGTLKVRARAHEVVHQIQWSSLPQTEGTNLVREYRLRGDRLVLSFPVSDTETAHGRFVRVR